MARFFDLQRMRDGRTFGLDADPMLCVGPPDRRFMFGGVGLGAAIAAMEQACERPLICASAQFASFAPLGSRVDISVDVVSHGQFNSQARAEMRVGDRLVIAAIGALGARPGEIERDWTRMPAVPPPKDCDEYAHWRAAPQGVHARFERRLANGAAGKSADGEGRLLLWIRPKEDIDVDAMLLAVLADHAPMGAGFALGRLAGGNSLDNTLRLHARTPTDWVLCDIAIMTIGEGLAHAEVRLFSKGGRLMASASQSLILRLRDSASDR